MEISYYCSKESFPEVGHLLLQIVVGLLFNVYRPELE